VPLAPLPTRVFTADDSLEADIEVTHFGASPLAGIAAAWKLVAGPGVVLTSGALPARDIPSGNATPLGRISVTRAGIAAPVACRLELSIPDTEAANSWDIWGHSPAVDTSVPASLIRASAMILDDLPRDLRPIAQVFDDWFTNRKPGLVFEARVGRDRLLVTSIDLEGSSDPVSRQLLASLLAYTSSDAFTMETTVPAATLLGIVRQSAMTRC